MTANQYTHDCLRFLFLYQHIDINTHTYCEKKDNTLIAIRNQSTLKFRFPYPDLPLRMGNRHEKIFKSTQLKCILMWLCVHEKLGLIFFQRWVKLCLRFSSRRWRKKKCLTYATLTRIQEHFKKGSLVNVKMNLFLKERQRKKKKADIKSN